MAIFGHFCDKCQKTPFLADPRVIARRLRSGLPQRWSKVSSERGLSRALQYSRHSRLLRSSPWRPHPRQPRLRSRRAIPRRRRPLLRSGTGRAWLRAGGNSHPWHTDYL